MKNELYSIMGSDTVDAIELAVESIDKSDMTSEQLAEYLSQVHLIYRTNMELIALSNGNIELANKIRTANQLIKQKTISAFKESVLNGTYEEFLSNMSLTDKNSLEVEMGLFRAGIPNEIPLSSEEQKYSDIIKSSVKKDIEKEALSQGFESVAAWSEHNRKTFNQRTNMAKTSGRLLK